MFVIRAQLLRFCGQQSEVSTKHLGKRVLPILNTTQKIWDHLTAAAKNQPYSRRTFLKITLTALAAIQLPIDAFAQHTDITGEERILHLHNIHTGEHFQDVYWCEGNYVAENVAYIDRLFRDYRTGEIRTIDRELLDLLYSIQRGTPSKEPMQIVSGFRSRKTNEYLIRKGRTSAHNSFHIKGKAVDINLPDVRLSLVRRKAVELKAGGVGYYPRHRFIHVDTGPIRYW